MLPLLNAIFAKFTSDSALVSAFPGGLHRDQAPESTAMPYLVSQVIHSKLEYSYSAPSRTETQIRFRAFGVGHDATGAVVDMLVSHFDDALLTLSSGANASITRVGDAVPVLHKHDAGGNDVWEWSVVYEYSVIG